MAVKISINNVNVCRSGNRQTEICHKWCHKCSFVEFPFNALDDHEVSALQADEIFTRPHQRISTATHIWRTNTVNVFRSPADSNVFACQIPLCCMQSNRTNVAFEFKFLWGEDTIRLLKLVNIYMDRQSQLTVTHHVGHAWIMKFSVFHIIYKFNSVNL